MNSFDQQTISQMKEAEKSLLACFLIAPDTFNVVGDSFTEQDFYDSNHALVFKSIQELADAGNPVDMVSVSQKIKQPGFAVVLSDIVSSVGSTSSYDYYAKIVKDYSIRRQLNELGQRLTYQAVGDNRSEDIIQSIEQKIADITATTRGGGGINTKEAVEEVIKNIRKLKEDPQEVVGITTGFGKLDLKLSGLHSSDLIILAARPARGKSAFALQLARNVAYRAGVPTLFFSLEMGAEQLVQRLVASESKVELGKIRSGKVSDKEMEALDLGGKIIKELPLYFNDKAGVQVKDIRSQIKLHNSKSEKKIGFIIVDYLQLMAIGNGKGNESMVQMVTEISRGLKMIAKEFNVPVLALSQLSRNVESRGGKPKLSDLRDSGSIEQDADIVMFLHAETADEDPFGQKDIELLIEKHRNGSTGSLSFKFDGAKMTFLEVDDIKEW